jgi:two-component system, LytTR family, response regulator
MKVFIIDDEPVARRALRDRCAVEHDLEVTGEYPDAESALTAIAADPPDLIFLDIKMGKMNGLQLARALDSAPAPLIVFTTAFDQHALEAFEVNAVDYLLKPFDQSRFQAMLKRIRERCAKRSADAGAGAPAALARLERLAESLMERRPRLLAESGGHLRMVDVAHIEMVSADRNYVELTAGQEVLHARSTLIQAEAAMRGQPILQINRSCLINLNHVRRVSRSARGDYVFVLSGGATVSSSERFRHRVRLGIEQFSVGSL